MQSLKAATPVILGYLPVGITFGLLASQQQLSIWTTVGLSALIYAGSAQFVALSFLGLGQISILQVFITIWLVNLRHFILSLAYLPLVREWGFWQRVRLFTFLTDETFAVLYSSDSINSDQKKAFAVAFYNYLSWNFATVLGYYGGSLIPRPEMFGLDFALTAMFVALISLFIKRPGHWVTFGFTLVLTLLFYAFLDLGKNSIIAAALIGSFIGWIWEKRRTS